MTTFSMQLYSARNFPPLADRLRDLAAIGYTDVECFRGLYDDVPGLKAALDENGLTARSGHFSVELLETDFARSIEIARTLGNQIVVLPYLMPDQRPTDGDGWRAFGARVGAIAEKVRGEGLRVSWHNHDFEMRALEGGACPLELILDAHPALEWEADLAWVVRGGADPSQWLRRYSGRISALHVKDIAPAGENGDEDGWADVGEGTLDWASLWNEGKTAGADLMIAEHDNPRDFNRFARASFASFNRFENGN